MKKLKKFIALVLTLSLICGTNVFAAEKTVPLAVIDEFTQSARVIDLANLQLEDFSYHNSGYSRNPNKEFYTGINPNYEPIFVPEGEFYWYTDEYIEDRLAAAQKNYPYYFCAFDGTGIYSQLWTRYLPHDFCDIGLYGNNTLYVGWVTEDTSSFIETFVFPENDITNWICDEEGNPFSNITVAKITDNNIEVNQTRWPYYDDRDDVLLIYTNIPNFYYTVFRLGGLTYFCKYKNVSVPLAFNYIEIVANQLNQD